MTDSKNTNDLEEPLDESIEDIEKQEILKSRNNTRILSLFKGVKTELSVDEYKILDYLYRVKVGVTIAMIETYLNLGDNKCTRGMVYKSVYILQAQGWIKKGSSVPGAKGLAFYMEITDKGKAIRDGWKAWLAVQGLRAT